MNDNAMQPADLLRLRLEEMLALLDQHDLTLAAAWLTMAIDAIPLGMVANTANDRVGSDGSGLANIKAIE